MTRTKVNENEGEREDLEKRVVEAHLAKRLRRLPAKNFRSRVVEERDVDYSYELPGAIDAMVCNEAEVHGG